VAGTAARSQLHVLGVVLLHFEAHKRLAAGAVERKVVHFFAVCTPNELNFSVEFVLP